MPELPEVETIARGLAQNLTGDVIESVWLGSKPEPLKSPAAEIVGALEQARIAGVRRVGKHIVVDLSRRSPVASRPKKQKQVPRFARNDKLFGKGQPSGFLRFFSHRQLFDQVGLLIENAGQIFQHYCTVETVPDGSGQDHFAQFIWH